MLNRITAALIATTLIAAPALAQTTNTAAPAAPAAQAQTKTDQTAMQKPVAQTNVKHTAKHVTKHASKHASRGKTVHQARHVTKAKTHQANNAGKIGVAAKRS